jgi:hypothetical protein
MQFKETLKGVETIPKPFDRLRANGESFLAKI